MYFVLLMKINVPKGNYIKLGDIIAINHEHITNNLIDKSISNNSYETQFHAQSIAKISRIY